MDKQIGHISEEPCLRQLARLAGEYPRATELIRTCRDPFLNDGVLPNPCRR